MRPNRLNTLIDMHTYGRPHGSATERAFIRKYIEPLPGAYQDTLGNWHVTIGESTVLWSCHTDTVHWNECRQTLHYDPATMILGLARKSKKHGNVLGADDTAGVFLCRELILAGIPGHYVFHYGEEAGGIGSRALAATCEPWLKTFKCAIALDRSGFTDVITYQGGSRCASDAFATSLAAGLNTAGLHYVGNDMGIYTDTAEYTHLIPECTNLSVGYFKAHSANEVLYVSHVFTLLNALLKLDTATLVISRDPTIAEDIYDHLYPYVDDYLYTVDRDYTVCKDSTYLDPSFGSVQRALRREREDVRDKNSPFDYRPFWLRKSS